MNGVLRLYLVKVTELASNVTTVVNSTADQMEIGRLHPYYDYRLSVSAVTISPGPYSTAIVVKTAEDGKYISDCMTHQSIHIIEVYNMCITSTHGLY